MVCCMWGVRARLGIKLLVVLLEGVYYAESLLLGLAGIIELMKKLLLREFDADARSLPFYPVFKY